MKGRPKQLLNGMFHFPWYLCQAHDIFSVEELSKKKNVKMAQIAIAWSIKKTTAPIIGTTKLENLKEMIGEWRTS